MNRLITRQIFNFSLHVQSKNTLRLPSFSHFSLQPGLINFINQKQIHTPTYIQYALMTSLNNDKAISNYHIVSPTGSGKTLAYLLPMIDELKKEEIKLQTVLTKKRRPRGLVIVPNKQLVYQLRYQAKQISHHCKIKVQGLNIGKSKFKQDQLLEEGIDIVVSTFQKVKKLIALNKLYLSCATWLIIDQADTLNDSQLLKKIFQDLSPSLLTRQNQNITPIPKIIVSSTTNSTLLTQTISKYLPNCKTLKDSQTHLNLHNIQHQFLHCQQLDKHDTLLNTLKLMKDTKTIIFCNTVKSLHDLQYFLQNCGISVLTLHSQLNKYQRLRNYQLFRDSQNSVMLSTDLGARGLDFPNLNRVINYDFPAHISDYLHRVGRTGRAGSKGYAISLYHKKNLPLINQLKGSSFNQPLKIKNSAYALKNRQSMPKNK